MRHVDHGLLDLVLQMLELRAHLGPKGRVEIAQRLVQQKDVGPDDRGAADRETLHLVHVEPARRLVELRRQAHQRRHRIDLCRDLAGRTAANLQPERQVLAHAHVREDGVVLKHEADAAAARRHVADIAPVEADLAAGRLLDARDHVHRGGLAAARRTQQRHELLVVYGQGEIVDGRHRTEDLRQIYQIDCRHDRVALNARVTLPHRSFIPRTAAPAGRAHPGQ